MSLTVGFFLISRIKFEEYCKLAHTIFPPPDVRQARKKLPSMRISMVKDKLLLQNRERSRKLRSFLHEFGEQPYVFKWNGVCLTDALFWLQKTKNIDLCQIQYRDASGLEWILFDESLKERYLELINPANFEARDLTDYLQRFVRDSSRDPSEDDALATERGEAMMDGIRILYDYLRLVDSRSVVMLHF